MAAAKAENTLRAYRSDWREFEDWAATVGLATRPATPETVALYIADLAAQEAKASTIARRLTSIGEAHRSARQASPTTDPVVVAVWDGIRRVHGTAVDNAAPIRVPMLARMIDAMPGPSEPGALPPLGSLRDQALLLIGFAGALRRSELAALEYSDLRWVDDGLVVTIRRSKTDQVGAGRRVGIPYGSRLPTCPVRATDAWCQAARIGDGRLFLPVNRGGHLSGKRLSAAAINRIVQRAVARTGTDPDPYSAHSLRAGFATYASQRGASDRAIAHQTRHRSLASLNQYIRIESAWADNAATALDL